MNPSNPFGSPQGGAFQVTNSTMKTGMFQPFGQQMPGNQPQTMGFFPPSAFGQPSAMNQPRGNAVFGQGPSFGQPSKQPSSLPSQTPAFGQSGFSSSSTPAFSSSSTPAFNTGSTPAFGQSGASNQSQMFGQTPSFGQASAFGQAPGFGQQTPGFGKPPPAYGEQTSGFGNSQMASGTATPLGQPQPLGFGQFGQPPSTSGTTNVFGAPQTQSKAFGTEFSFKPANDALFKPIFSASPEPSNPQTTSMSSSPFGGSETQTKSSTMSSSGATGFSVLTGEKSGPLGFSFSQPAAAPSISAQNNQLTTGKSSSPTNLQFTFSQPAAPSSTNTNASTTQPTTPSSFSFSAKALQPQPVSLFGGASTGQPPAFGERKATADSGTDSKTNSFEGMAETNVFARLGKSTKRKDDTGTANPDPELVAEDEETAETDAPRQPPKRPLIRSRGPPGGLFGRALSGLRRDVTPPATREGRTTQQQTSELDLEKEDTQSQGDHPAATQPAVPPVTRDVLPKVEESEAPKPLLKTTTPMRRGVRRESSDSGLSPTDCTVLQCRNLRPAFNKKENLERHFSRFGKVSKILCRPAKNLAIVHFDDHVSAARAKKKGKMMHKQELLLLWQRKKQSPGDKGSTPTADQEQAEEEIHEDTQSHSSPLRRPQLRAPVVGSMVTFSRSSPVKRSSLAKSLQFDSDQKESTNEAQSSERIVPSSLLHLIGQVAETAEDKYRLLEQRDKVLRQGRPKRQDLDLSKVFVGTCSDMCPEKERYMRETRKQLSTFEVIPNTEMVDHATAIKEYSRSSADQEEPLPHDLRPLPVLSMTMDYLVTRIMDQGFDNFRDWYDFVWNRTRGIRKDITQQRLCCPHTVSLIEKCTRFHVHCAHHLCEEPMSAFDPKINNENMTKCLQSLKEMYEDLKSRNIFCPREAEFRQYNVLLKLNDGDILREVQQFRDEVRNSPEVKFAVQTFAALNSNNFVRFFKLVKGASYLASCLLHRYFNQVRAKALKTLIMAHTMGPRSSTGFPLEDIVRMLMFHDAEEAADVIQQYGLNVNDGLVELSRVAYQDPELPLSQKKSDIILAKKTMLIGEVVNGSSLPTPPQHTPVCSFDSQNKYRGEGPLAEPTSNQFKDIAVKVEVKPPLPSVGLLPQVVPTKPADLKPSSLFGLPPSAETGEPDESYHGLAGPAGPSGGQQLFQPIFQPEPVKPPSPPPKPQPAYSDEDINAEVDSVINEFVDATVMEVATAGAAYATTALAESSVQVESLVSEVLGQMLQEISADEFHLEQQCVAEEKRKLEEARRKQEHEAFLVEFSFSLCKDIIHEVLDETIKETATSEMQQALDDKAQCVAKCTEQVCTSLVEETLNADISLLIEEILNVELQRIHKYIKRWRDVVAVRRQLKRQMRGFPASPCCVDPRFKLKALAPSAPAQASLEDLVRGVVNLGNAGTLALSSTRVLKMRRDAMHQMRVHYYYQQLLDKMVWSPLDLPALVMESLDNPPDRIFWKAVVLLPSDDESVASPADRILCDWLEVKLGGGKESKVTEEKPDGMLQNLCVSNTLQENGERTHKVHLSIKVSRGPLTEDGLSKMEECYDLQGTGALVLLLPALPIADPKHDEQDVPLLSALLQLKQLQQASTWHCPLPLVILVPGPDSGDSLNLEEALMLHKLVQVGLISEYTFVFIPETTSDPEGSKQLSHAMRWLMARAPPCFPLSCQTLVQLVEATLSHEFSPRVHAHRQERNSAHLPPQDLGPVIRLYNAVLAHVADRVSSPELCELSWPPGEFCLQDNREFVPHLGWNSPSHLAWLREAILSLQLPECDDVSATESWSEQCSAIFRYAAQIPATHCSQPLLISRLENLLERVRAGYPIGTPVSTATSGTQGRRSKRVTPAHSQIPWDDVVVMCIDHKLKDWQIPGRPVCEDAVTEDGEIFVYLPKESDKSFEPPEEWTKAVRQTHREKQEENTGATAAACVTPTGHFPRQRLFQSFVEPVEAPAAPLDISHTPTAEELLAHKVLQNLEEEKAESKRSMEQLRRWMEGDTLGNWSTSLFLPSSTLLSMPATIMHTPADKARHPAEDPEPDDLLDKANWKKASPLSMTKQLKELERQILASQEEELACRLKLSGMLSIVDD